MTTKSNSIAAAVVLAFSYVLSASEHSAEIGYGLVPHVELDTIQMDEVTLYECLFSPDWDASSRDGDDPAPENLRETVRLRRPPTSIMLTRMTKSKRQAIIDHLMSLDLPDP